MIDMRPFSFVLSLSSLLACVLGVAACTTERVTPARLAPDTAPLVLTAVDVAALPFWNGDDVNAARPALEKSCARILRANPDAAFGVDARFGRYADWQAPCADLMQARADNVGVDMRGFMVRWFNVYAAAARVDGPDKNDADNRLHDNGLFTGYYEASLNGSRTRHGAYQTPLRARPADLVMVDLGQFRDGLKGQRIAGRVVDGTLKPYETRAEIESETAALADDDARVIVWVDDPVDVFFLHIQGSGRVQLDDGSVMHVGYAGQNGHVYTAIGRELIARGALGKENVSMQTIRTWLEQNPDQAESLMNINQSYVYFTMLAGDGPLGGENVALTPMRSLAIDRSKIPYGVPLWLDAGGPGSDVVTPDGGDMVAPLRHLMVAQDTGGAIRGAVRGDVFFGFGADAEQRAGIMKSDGRYWLFIPKSIHVEQIKNDK